MNYRMTARLIGIVLRFVALFMLPALAISLVLGETGAARGLGATVALMALLSCVPLAFPPRKQTMYARDGFAVVALTWLLISLLGALPFYLSGAIPNYIDCLFETVSGFTTTGASILSDVEALPKGLIYWRSFTHWLGGMGVLVFLLAITRFTAGSGDSLHIMRAESPGPQVNKLVPQTFYSAQIVYIIYIGMTAVQIVLMLLGGTSLFESVTLTFGTAGTGGFAVRNDGMVSYSPYIQWVVTIFMALFGVNFGVYYLLLQRSFKKALHNEELWLYWGLIFGVSLLIFLDILPSFPGKPWDALRHSFFQVSSIITTTGYATADFNLWPQLSRTLLIALMLIGACAGSTGGGLKVSRVLILLKSVGREIRRMVHPNTVKHVRMDGEALPQVTIQNTFAFLSAYFIIAVVSVCLLSPDGFSFETNFTAMASCLNNIGPGLDAVGPMSNFGAYGNFSKIVLSLDMLLGRLEIFPILILFMPDVWKRAR